MRIDDLVPSARAVGVVQCVRRPVAGHIRRRTLPATYGTEATTAEIADDLGVAHHRIIPEFLKARTPDDTIDRYLPDYPRDAASKITIAQLVEHRGGVGDIFGPRYAGMDRSKLRRVSDWIPLFRDEPLHFEPGSRREYSNGGYVLLGAIVEQVSGRDYYDHVRARIYRPAGMNDTDHFADGDPVENLARGYTRRLDTPGEDDGTGLRDNGPTRPWRGSPAGGGYSTVDDLDRFVQALRGGRLLDAKWTAWAVGDAGGIGVAGGAPGINAALETNGPYTIAVLANLDPPAAERVALWIRGALPIAPAGKR